MGYDVVFYDTFWEMLSAANENYVDMLFLEDTDGKHTYAAFYYDIMRAVSYYHGFSQKYIVLCIPNQYKFAVSYFGIILSGHIACLVPENHLIPTQMNDKYIVSSEDWNRLECCTPAERPLCNTSPDAPCTIAFSSDTSSKNKGCILSQTNLLHDAQYSMKIYHYWKGERLIHILPFWHLFGIVADLIGPIHQGCSLYVPENSTVFFKSMEYFRPHCVNMPPALADTLCAVIEKVGPKVTGGTLKKILCAGAPMNDATAEKLLQYGILPCTAYGLTECSPCVAITPDDDVPIGTSGKPIPCVDIKIVDGEITIAGSTVMLGYYEDDKLTRETIVNGYLHTGDVGYLKNGHLVVTGRKDNMLIFENGIKCVPEYVEGLVNRIEGVQESLVRKDIGNKIPELVIVCDNLSEDMKSNIKNVMIQESLYPFVLKLQTEKIERNSMGKVVRYNEH